MKTTDDFTQLPEGASAFEGTIERCSRCGRNGVVRKPEAGTAYCVHAEQTTMLCDGMLTEPIDCCDLA